MKIKIPDLQKKISDNQFNPHQYKWSIEDGNIYIETDDELYGVIELWSNNLAKRIVKSFGVSEYHGSTS